ncbi:MAG: hypothetical protein LQ351_003685 [Letrouitia transgressa]|nr:MAG: hypothetical protein LQ351_003685 [Letrouitia transgressa]
MSKSLLAIVWVAGPLTGTLVQPYIGVRSDNCRIRYGKRRPFMLVGATASLISFLSLAWAREIVGGFLGLFGADAKSDGVKVVTICFAIIWVYIVDIAINAVQAAIRAFIVDNAPTHQQEPANAWAGIITGIGNILGYYSSYVNLPKLMPFFGNTQFKVLSVITCIALGSTVLISSIYITERDPRVDGPPPNGQSGIIAIFKKMYRSMRQLPPQIRKVCEVQFFNWIGWFPFLFYITTYIGQLEVNPTFAANPDLSPEEVDEAWESATRVGSFALLIFAFTSFTSNLLLPFLVIPSYRAQEEFSLKTNRLLHESTTPSRHHERHPSSPSTPGARSASTTSYFPSSPKLNTLRQLTHLLSLAQIPWLTLRRAWLLSHLLFALCMASTFAINTPTGATVMVGVTGLSWAVSLWAPFALISAEISKRDAQARKTGGTNEDQAGVVLGLHNVAMAAPQFLATLMSSIIFRIAQKPRGKPYDDSVGWVLRLGGVAALVAAYMTIRIQEEGEAGGSKKRKTSLANDGEERV